MVKIKRILKSEGKRTWRDALLGSKDDIKIASHLIETKIISQDNYSEKDKLVLDRIYDDYRRAIKLTPAKRFRDFFWRKVDNGEEMVVMAVDGKTRKPLGFIKLYEEKAKYGQNFYLTDFYTLPKYRKKEIASKLARKAWDIARMKGYTSVRSSFPLNEAGKRTVLKADERQKEWAAIPQDRFPKYDDYMAGLRKRKHFK